ncbi:MAG: metal-dependent hydrolase [Syntrophorhabdaceae bacterium PtaU1.Bin034]|jgi:L-ascorbate metabolism protein UlaG (beta-lactamase superfamily)|nr:MAG: metal-dependent hydrolase [Syntrophorhabdaceae bacterium PtaU1.Bin034]
MKIQRLSTSSFKFYSPQGKVIMVDPWLTNDPFWPLAEKAPDKIEEIDVVIVTHAHFDHASGVMEIVAQNEKAFVVGQFEYALSLLQRGVKNAVPTNFGACVDLFGVKFSMVPASHTNSEILPGGKSEVAGTAAGFVVEFENKQKVYISGDTGLTADMKFVVGEYHKPLVSILPVTGVLFMEPEQAAYAARMTGCKFVIPCHDFPKDVSDAADPEGYREFLKQFPVQDSYKKVKLFMEIMEKEYPDIKAMYIPIGGSVEI